MDHLLLPTDPVASKIGAVPYVVTTPYDGGPFLTYAVRQGRPWLSLPPDSRKGIVEHMYPEKLQPLEKEEQEAFFQTWLFFGLLREVLGDLYREEYFLVQDRNKSRKSFISTTSLVPLLIDALSIRTGYNAREQVSCEERSKPRVEYEDNTTKKFDHISDCLKLAAYVIRAAGLKMDGIIRFSIASVCEAIAYTLPPVWRKVGGMCETACFHEAMRVQMLSAGWCPSDVQRSIERFSRGQTLYFVSRMSRFSLIERKHELCTPSRCLCFQFAPGAYNRRHREPGCECADLSEIARNALVRDVLGALEFEALPLLQIKKSNAGLDSLSVEVIKSSVKTPYIAISHVWADGLGNPVDNNLPKCQLSLISEFAAALNLAAVQLEGTLGSTSEKGSPLLVWLDTLCCPVEREGKKLALAQMRRTYEQASHVLVLDASIQCYDSRKIHVVEALMRIFTSVWLQRLWTLQEGALAAKLWFQFKNGPVYYGTLLTQLSSLTNPGADSRYLPIFGQISWEHQFLGVVRGSFPQSPALDGAGRTAPAPLTETSTVNDVLTSLDTGLLHRSVSVAADESLCIGTLLNLPIKEIASGPEDAELRMGRVWRLIAAKYRGLPQQILIFKEPKLVEKGMRWAPKSFLSVSQSGSSSDRNLRWTGKSLGIPEEDGLLVKSIGFKLKFRDKISEKIRDAWRIWDKLEQWEMLCKGDDGVRYSIVVNSKPLKTEKPSENGGAQGQYEFLRDLVRQDSCAVLLPEERDTDQSLLGLVVQIKRETSGILYVESQCHVTFDRILPEQSAFLDSTEKLAQKLQNDPLTARLLGFRDGDESVEYKDAAHAMELKIRSVVDEALKDKALVRVVKECLGDDPRFLSVVWYYVVHWFNHDLECTWLKKDQQWCVD